MRTSRTLVRHSLELTAQPSNPFLTRSATRVARSFEQSSLFSTSFSSSSELQPLNLVQRGRAAKESARASNSAYIAQVRDEMRTTLAAAHTQGTLPYKGHDVIDDFLPRKGKRIRK